MRTFDSSTWTGRSRRVPPAWMRELAFPYFSCEFCVGQEYWQGCWCAYHRAEAPGDGEIRAWRRLLRSTLAIVWLWEGYGYADA